MHLPRKDHFPDEPLISMPVRLPLVDRKRERAFLRERLLASAAGDGATVVITAPAGMGKSRLTAETLASAAAVGVAAVHVDVHPIATDGSALSYVLLERLTQAGLADASPSAVDAARALDVVLAAARAQPLVVAIDDVHAFDEHALAFVEGLSASVTRAPLVLLLNVRIDERRERAHVRNALARIERRERAYAMRLSPLPSVELGEAMLEAVRRRRPLTPRVRDDILERAAGNPFYVEELLRSYVDGDDRPRATSAGANIVERFGRLSRDARRLGRAAAVLGIRFDLAAAARLIGLGDRERNDALRELRDAALVREANDACVFEHALAREAIRATLLDDEARALHAAAARDLAERDADALERAAHALAARLPEASALTESAADVFLARGNARRAAELYSGALAMPLDDDTRARLIEKAAGCRERLAESREAYEMLAEAAAIHERAGRTDEAAHVAIERGRLAFNTGSFARVDAALAHVRTLAPTISEERRRRAFITFALLYAMAGRSTLSVSLAEELGADPPDPADAARFHRMRALVRATAGDPRWREDAEATLGALSPGASVARANAFNILAVAAYRALDHERAQTYNAQAIAVAAELGFTDIHADAHTNAAGIRLDRGPYDRIAAHVEAALAIGSEGFGGSNTLAALVVLVGIARGDDALLARIDIDALRNHVRRPAAPTSAGPHVVALSEWYRRDGRTSLNRALLDEFANTVEDAYGAWHALALVARYGTGSSPARAQALLDVSASSHPSPLTEGFRRLSLAFAEARSKNRTASRKHARAAAAHFVAAGTPMLQARALEAADETEAAATIYETCGATYHAQRLRTPTDRTTESASRLTAREREILRAVHDGTTANEVGATLFLSRRTVESHIASAYRKLGIRTRAALRKALDADPGLLDA